MKCVLFLFYVFRSLAARARANVVTMFSVALFVTGGSIGLTTYLSLKQEVVDNVPAENVLVLGEGAASERGSRLKLETAQELAVLDGVKRDGNTPVIAQEALTDVFVNTTDFERYEDPVALRGIDPLSPQIHHVTMVEGKLPEPGTLQIIVGRKLARRDPQLAIGSDLFLPGGASRITGVFAAGGSPFELELWTPRSAFDIHLQQKAICCETLVAAPGKTRDLVAAINTSKGREAQAISVVDYRAHDAGLATVLRLVLILLVLLAVVATSAIAMTMNAAVLVRRPEFASMIAIGIRRGRLARLVILESVLLATIGGLIGIGVAEVLRRVLGSIPVGKDAVELAATTVVPLIGFGLGIFVGLVGGLAPSIIVRRLDVLQTLR